jgi:Ni/Fe-hydrogenase subunit HybB-like protein
MNTHEIRLEPIGGPIITRPFLVLATIASIGVLLILWRFATGLGASTALNDGYPWGLWIAFDVVVGTALATGGYAVAILIYILNRGKYHPLIRSAILTSALGYSLGGFAVVLDLGRFYNIFKVPLMFWRWNLHSVLLEVALCIMLYTIVLWLEVSPAFLEKWRGGSSERLSRFSEKVLPILERALPWLIALGLLLPTMHQSSLGSLMLLAGSKLHPLWQSPILPLLFLLSCVGMGYSVVVIESALSSAVFKRRAETQILSSLSGAIVTVLGLYIGLRFADVILRGRFGMLLALEKQSFLFIAEIVLFIIPAIMLLNKEKIRDLGYLFRAAMLIILAGALYRFSTFLIAFNPGQGWRYFPAITELLITTGIVALEIMAYIVIVKKFPILAGTTPVTTPKASIQTQSFSKKLAHT